jgi:hypothetical protein
MDATERLINSISVDDNGCWVWQKYITYKGYGHFRLNGKKEQAHRGSYMIFVGEIPSDLQLDHLCRVRACVNPDHLEAVTARENARRGVGVSGRREAATECKDGHEFTKENTMVWHNMRRCRTCFNAYSNKLYHKRKVALA